MSKRRRASELLFGKKRCLKYPAKVVAITSGTGTDTKGGVISVLCASGTGVATTAYITVQTSTNIGTLVGTAGHTPSNP